MGGNKIKLPEMVPDKVADEIGKFVIETVLQCGSRGGVIGLSGGVDSTTTAALVQRAFVEHNKTNEPLELVAYMLPSALNSTKDTEDGVRVSEKLRLRYEIQNLQPIVDAFHSTNPEAFTLNYQKGNLISRIRANVLQTKAATEGKILIGTGNMDEDFGIGYYTLFGDGAVACSPIGHLSKRLVFQMAAYLGFGDIAEKEPAAGLEPGQTDFKDLGYRYNAVEMVLAGLRQGFRPDEMVEMEQVKAMIIPQLAINKKFHSVGEVVEDIMFRHYQIAIPKQQIIHPSAAPVTLFYR